MLKAQSIKTGIYYALKCMKKIFETFELVNTLVEVQALKELSLHPQIVKLIELL